MESQASESASGGTSESLLNLNLPVVGPDEGPLPAPEPSYELAQAHALFPLRARKDALVSPDRMPNPERFVLD